MVGNLAPVVVIAVGDDRVAVVRAAHDAVQLVAAGRAHLDHPELPVGVEGHAQRIAMTQGPDLVVGADAVDERLFLDVIHEGIVRGRRTVVLEAQDLAHVALHVLGRRELLPIARGDPQVTVVVEGESMSVMAVVEHLRILAPDDFGIGEPAATFAEFEYSAHDRRTAGIACAALGVAQVDDPVVRVARVQDHVAEPALAAVVHVRQTFDRA